MIQFGTVQATDPSQARVRVQFRADRIVSAWLPVLMTGTGDTKTFRMPSTGERVVCLMDKHREDGVVIGAIYDAKNQPTASATVRMEFPDGAVFSYDAGTSKMTFEVSGTTLEASPAGWAIKKTGESLKDILDDLLTQLQAETHTVVSIGSPTSPPLNLALYTAIQARINLFFTS